MSRQLIHTALISAPLLAIVAFAAASTFGASNTPGEAAQSSKPTPAALPSDAAVLSDTPPSMATRRLLSKSEIQAAAKARILPANVKSLLATNETLRHGDFFWDDKGLTKGKLTIWVDLRRQMVSAFRNGHEIGSSVIVYGARDAQSPLGDFPIRTKVRDYHSRSYDQPMPHSLFITDDGVALHGSPMAPDRATHGCIGLPLEFARLLFEAAGTGDIVTIVRSDPAIENAAF